MANYTMTLNEYLVDNELPSEFNLIASAGDKTFKKLFELVFGSREIAVDSDLSITDMQSTFKDKLKARACIVCPFYQKKLTAYTSGIDTPFSSNRTETTTANGKTTEKNYDTPLNAGSLEQSSISSGRTSEVNNGTSVLVIEGVNGRENKIDLMVKLQDNIKNLYEMLLKEFECMFIALY